MLGLLQMNGDIVNPEIELCRQIVCCKHHQDGDGYEISDWHFRSLTSLKAGNRRYKIAFSPALTRDRWEHLITLNDALTMDYCHITNADIFVCLDCLNFFVNIAWLNNDI